MGSVSDVLNDMDSRRPAPAVSSLNDYLAREPPSAGFRPGAVPSTPNERAFQNALDTIRAHPEKPAGKFEDLLTTFPPGA